MMKWFAVLILSAVMGGNALAGLPQHGAGQACAMMDCCQLAQAQRETPEVMAARLCCAINCPQSGTTEPKSTLRLAPLVLIVLHPATIQPRLTTLGAKLSANSAQVRRADSQPIYIRHLALLI